jgi:hypothetical protein
MYSKIFRRIYESSIAENPVLRFTFMDLLVLADRDGVVDMTHEAIARITNRPLKEIRETICILEASDPKSRSPEEGGARIRRLDNHRDWGWVIVNYDRFHQRALEEDRRTATRERVRNYRLKSRKHPLSEEKPKCNAPVTPCNDDVTPASVYVYVSNTKERGTGETVYVSKIDTFEWLQTELCGMYKRKGGRVNMGEEEHLVAAVSRRPDVKSELEELKRYRLEKGEQFFPQSIKTLCSDWDAALDKSRNHSPAPKQYHEKSILEKESDAFCARIMKEP